MSTLDKQAATDITAILDRIKILLWLLLITPPNFVLV